VRNRPALIAHPDGQLARVLDRGELGDLGADPLPDRQRVTVQLQLDRADAPFQRK
jgi:hypothetical protein